MATASTFRVPLRVVFYREEGAWIAHCLEFDVCGDGDSRESALRSLSEAISIQVTESIKHSNLNNLFSPAPSEIQAKFFSGKPTAHGQLRLELGKKIDDVEFEQPEYREFSDSHDEPRLVEA